MHGKVNMIERCAGAMRAAECIHAFDTHLTWEERPKFIALYSRA